MYDTTSAMTRAPSVHNHRDRSGPRTASSATLAASTIGTPVDRVLKCERNAPARSAANPAAAATVHGREKLHTQSSTAAANRLCENAFVRLAVQNVCRPIGTSWKMAAATAAAPIPQ